MRQPSVSPIRRVAARIRAARWRDWVATGAMIAVAAIAIVPRAQVQASSSVLIDRAAVRALPMSGTAWTNLKKYADGSAGTPDIADQDSNNDVRTLAEALVYVRTGTVSYRTRAIANIKGAVGTEAGGRTLALARNLPSYVIAADLVDLRSVDSSFDANVFRPWLRALLTKTVSDGTTLRKIHEQRPNNWGTHAGAARAAIAVYLGDATELARTATVFKGWLGDRSAYSGFKYGSDVSWQADTSRLVAINASGAAKTYNGTKIDLDGSLPDEMRRGGSFRWAPSSTGYPWEALQGAVLQAEILSHNGYDAWHWSNDALARAARWLTNKAAWPATGDDRWQPWLIDARTDAKVARPSSTSPGKNFGFADWLYG
jgi:hypothetical protein